ncbi:phage major capsid protein [Piscinibacter defluvii]|uniref:phage major capsid protein n=1 Tax=Piscinibacter defluvii TaxID=1796922 RepID=UPI000FDCFBA8|nr:phage major capsid protein [Piscinibacter defluvii]
MTRLEARRGTTLAHYVKALAAGQGDRAASAAYAMGRSWSDSAQIAGILKSAVTAHSLAELASVLGPISSDLVELVRPLTIVGRLESRMRRVPFGVKSIRQAGGAQGRWVEEGAAIPASRLDLDAAANRLMPKRVAAIAFQTDEIAKHSDPSSDAIISNDVAAALAPATDLAFADPTNAGDDATPASVFYGAASIPSSGSDVGSIDEDLRRLCGLLLVAGSTLRGATWVMSARTAAYLAFLRDASGARAYPAMRVDGGTIAGMEVQVSASVPEAGSPAETTIGLLDPAGVNFADDGQARVDVSTRGAVQMDDAPTNDAGAGTGASVVSLWQVGAIAIAAQRYMNWSVARAGFTAYISGVAY